MFALLVGKARVGNDPGEQFRGFAAARSPDNLASCLAVPFFTHTLQPGTQKGIPLAVRADSQRLKVPAVAPVIPRRELRPEFWRLWRTIVPEGDSAFASHCRRRIGRQ